MAIDALENQTSNLEWTIFILLRVIFGRKKLSGSSGLKWNFVVIMNGNEKKIERRRFRIVGNIFERLKLSHNIEFFYVKKEIFLQYSFIVHLFFNGIYILKTSYIS